MDYEIAYSEEEHGYRVQMNYEFSVIADWISEHLTGREDIQKVLQCIRFAEDKEEISRFTQGNFDIVIQQSGVSVSRKVDMSDARDEIVAMFDNQSDFYQTSEEGIQAECGLEDLTGIIENWHDVVQ
ncbi:YacL family protein [Marinomonas algicola]|uniref:YacL family protein n=1 Tax=Marinomonas algicola TaxID=2773454 RepID=UPI0017480604|nr:YacL family protein [Marinomonas algicola]